MFTSALTSYRSANPYRVTLVFTLDCPEVNMCESQRGKRAGSTYTWQQDVKTARHALQIIEAAERGDYDTLSEHVCTIDSVRWGKCRGSRMDGACTFRKRQEDRERVSPVNPDELALAKRCAAMSPEELAAYHTDLSARCRAEMEAA
jgi:hypothetical protein